MEKLELIMYNVGHGLAISLIEYPDKYVTQIDLGSDYNFSPLRYLSQSRQLRPDILYITHPHGDHLSDIENAFVPQFHTNYLHYQEYDWNDVESREKPERRHLIKLLRELTRSVPSGGYQGGGSVKVWRCTPENAASTFSQSSYINNSSLCIIYRWKAFKISIFGDLESTAMERLINYKDFQNDANNTYILIAPHHGHVQGYTSDWPVVLGKTYVNLISVQSRDSNIASGYSSNDFAKGITFAGKTRRRLTTRNDGTIVATMYYGSDSRPKWSFTSE